MAVQSAMTIGLHVVAVDIPDGNLALARDGPGPLVGPPPGDVARRAFEIGSAG